MAITASSAAFQRMFNQTERMVEARRQQSSILSYFFNLVANISRVGWVLEKWKSHKILLSTGNRSEIRTGIRLDR